VSSTEGEFWFRMSWATKLKKLMAAYAGRVGKDIDSIRFIYNGEQISGDDTPVSLKMEDYGTL
ncbi:hypothetical protein B0H11DRAFT_1659437, partial [Mycena galericulata]